MSPSRASSWTQLALDSTRSHLAAAIRHLLSVALSLARLHTPAAHPLQIRISISEIPSNDDLVLTAADHSARVELQLENTVAAFAVVGEVVVGLCVGLSMGLGVG